MMGSAIRPCEDRDFETLYEIINDAAEAYRGIIPPDRWKEPYMSKDELRHEIEEGVRFWGYEEDGELLGVMGMQDVRDVTLIRHVYVRTARRGQGIGGKLLSLLRKKATHPILVGTWAAAVWAVRFYEAHGFYLVSPEEKDRLLKRYWSIPERQIETSVVLAEPRPPYEEEEYLIPIVSIVGRSNTGKTTLIERLIPELKKRGYRVATIKHNIHGFAIDHEGKDSWRHKKAGARVTVIASPHSVAVVEDTDKDYELAELKDRYIRDVDIILSEGFKRNPHPKIEIVRAKMKHDPLCSAEDNLLAVVSDEPVDRGVPCLLIDDIRGVADLIEDRFLKGKTA